jgi:hypothetical protein
MAAGYYFLMAGGLPRLPALSARSLGARVLSDRRPAEYCVLRSAKLVEADHLLLRGSLALWFDRRLDVLLLKACCGEREKLRDVIQSELMRLAERVVDEAAE